MSNSRYQGTAPFLLCWWSNRRRITLTALHTIAEKREHTIHKVNTKPYSKSNHQQTKQARTKQPGMTNPVNDHRQYHQPDDEPFSIERPLLGKR
ncbi:hypothetical protein A9G83_004689 [Salmonella enterica subsp. enterica serovar Sundsvall]|nr:hypothetical protein [Salmonella enterica subsp. enterica serovar Sundsvall]EEM1821134.1 hypothetical protein [Salmonella enterica subsp. enterica serovar Abaetetuba]